MSNILFAWELGSHFGHLSRDWPLARQMRLRGHGVSMALADLSAAQALGLPQDVVCVQSPRFDWGQYAAVLAQGGRGLPLVNFADLLLSQGWGQEALLSSLLRGWLGLFELFQPDALVYDFAPTALLAARVARLPCLLLGNSFEIPRPGQELAMFRSWEKADEQQKSLAQGRLLEQGVLAQANAVLQRWGAEPLARLADLYAGHSVVMPTLAQLDHFSAPGRERRDVIYCGPSAALAASQTGLVVAWPPRQGLKLLVYLRARAQQVELLMEALCWLQAEMKLNVVCLMPDVSEAWVERFSTIAFEKRYVDLQACLAGVDFVLTHGSMTAMQAVLQAVPVLLAPQVVEQYHAARALCATGAAHLLLRPAEMRSCAQELRGCLEDARYGQAASAFAAQHAQFSAQSSLAVQTQALEKVLAIGRVT